MTDCFLNVCFWFYLESNLCLLLSKVNTSMEPLLQLMEDFGWANLAIYQKRLWSSSLEQWKRGPEVFLLGFQRASYSMFNQGMISLDPMMNLQPISFNRSDFYTLSSVIIKLNDGIFLGLRLFYPVLQLIMYNDFKRGLITLRITEFGNVFMHFQIFNRLAIVLA